MKKIIIRLTCLSIIVLQICSDSVFSFDLQTDQTRAASASMLSDALPATLLESPTAGLFHKQVKLQIGYTTFYEMAEYKSYATAVAYRHKWLYYAFGLSQFGITALYKEHTIKSMVGAVYNKWSGGVIGSFRSLQFNDDYENLSAISFGLGLSWRSERLIFALAVDDLNQPRFNPDSEKYNSRWLFAVELIGHKNYSTIGRIRLENNYKPQFEIAQKLRISDFGSLGWGLSTAPFVYGGGLVLHYEKWEFNFSVDYHSRLGLTTAAGMNFSFGPSKNMVP